MKILVTGAKGFVGKNLVANLCNVRDGKDKRRQGLSVQEIFAYDLDTDPTLLEHFCAEADFVFHLAGVNRPQDPTEFIRGNFGFTGTLLDTLKKHRNPAPVMLASSVQATLHARYAKGEYGKSKRMGEELLFSYGAQTGAPVFVYRFPNLFGKWCRPHYNSAVATFCYHTANDLPVSISDPATELELLYIDDLVENMLDLLEGKVFRCEYEGTCPVERADGRYSFVPITHRIALGELAALLSRFHAQTKAGVMAELPEGSFEKKLYATYLSYLPREQVCRPLKMNTDARGSFTELLKTEKCGQLSVNITLPGMCKGEHWHNSKWEIFAVVAGHGLIEQRKLGTDEVLRFEVSGKQIRAVVMLPGYTHRLVNLSQEENLVTVMWASEPFDPGRPDTFFEAVER